MKILPTQYNYTYTNYNKVSKTPVTTPIIQPSSEQTVSAQNVNFRGFFDLFKREKKYMSGTEAVNFLDKLEMITRDAIQRIVKFAGNDNPYNFKCSKAMIEKVAQLAKDDFDVDDMLDRTPKNFYKENFPAFFDNLYKIKNLGYPIRYIPEFFEGGLSKEEDAKVVLEILNEAYKRKEELSYPFANVRDDEIEQVFLDDPVKTRDITRLLGKKDFINTFSLKIDNVENNIEKIGDIEFDHPLIEQLLELTNPIESAKYKENEQKIKALKSKFKETEDKTSLIKEINDITNANKNLVAKSIKDPIDKVKLAHVFYRMRNDEKKLRYVLNSSRSNTKDGRYKFKKLISNAIITDSDGNVCNQLNFKNNKYLMNLYTADENFSETFDTLLKAINQQPFMKGADIFNDFPLNQKTKKQFTELGINFDKWVKADNNSVIQKEVKLKNEDRTKHVIRNLEEDFSDSLFDALPKTEVEKLKKAMADKGYTLRDCSVAKYEGDGFMDGINTVTKLYKGEKLIKFEDLPALFKVLSNVMEKDEFWTTKNSDKAIDDAINTLKNHILTMRYREMRSANQKMDEKPMQMCVRKVDMNNVEHALFLGNRAGCCTAVGSGFNQWTAPNYVMCKLISAIEVLDGKEPIGNTMCYIAEIDGKPSLVLDNIELRAKYQYNDEIRDSIFDYAKKITEEIAKPDMPIYAGPNRHKVNMGGYPMSEKEFRIIGSTGTGKLYFDFDGDAHAIDGTEVFEAELYKIR